ncbi:Tfp pilus assembly protein FimV [Aeromicrobium panaciterrae]|uniref:Tfp pilus assembly protein FimV n=1 Tax=Aeromicrobium panaciterrae TaxID=363861 RepID=A0ABU1UQW9_9ACTN|nr:hypothetical protein [Aeromicrobium panaciterrae]MDR7087584.1 Tfp pilus assembly protein FimV [Aeromicrobium panaciterrae]
MSGYTIGEIIIWLLLAALLGGLLGWFLRQLRCEREHGAGASSAPAPAKAVALSGGIESAGPVNASKGGRAPTAEYTIKGNTDSMYFHTPGSPSYDQTIAEVWFKSEAEARAAGYTPPGTGGAKKAAAKKAPAKKAPAKAAAKKAPAKAVAKKAPVKVAAKKAPVKVAAKKAPVKVAAKKAPVKAVAKKAPAKKAPAKKAVAAGKFPGSARPLSGGRAPSAAYKIKGNEDSMIYHTPDSPFYGQTIAETWFRTEAAAVAAGFRKPRNA